MPTSRWVAISTTFFFCFWNASAAFSRPSEVELKATAGTVDYEEHFDFGIDSEWSSSYVGFAGEYDVFFRGPWMFNLGWHGWFGMEDTEQWRESGSLVQENDTDLLGLDFEAAGAYNLAPSADITLAPLGGLAIRLQEFTRSGFNVYDADYADPGGQIEESFLMVELFAGAMGRMELSPDWHVAARATAGSVLSYEADNSAFGSIDGDGGTVIRADLSAGYQLDSLRSVQFGLYYRYQDLRGGTADSLALDDMGELVPVPVVLPDNELEQVGVAIAWRSVL